MLVQELISCVDQHTILLYPQRGDEAEVIPYSGTTARLERSIEHLEPFVFNGKVFTQLRKTFSEVVGLPPPREGVLYVVSSMVLNALPERTDLRCPGYFVDQAGLHTACRGLCIK
jgi:hypothetical protein